MGTVEGGQNAISLDTNPGTSAFAYYRPAGFEQLHYVRPRDGRAEGIGEYGGQGFAVFVVHACNSTTF
jgi:hypothetical protein